MRIQVKLFAILRDKAKVGSFDLDIAERSTVSEAFARLAEMNPSIAVYLPRVSAAVNREYVRGEHVLQDGDELALIPPVSGG
jgi:molybdopterin converting factor subunit 1